MAHYESMILLKSSLTDEEVNGMTEKFNGVIVRLGGQVTQVASWGKKKLAYEINHEKKAIYLIFRIDAGGTLVKEFERACRLDEQVIRVMTVAVDPQHGLPAVATAAAASPAPAPAAAQTESHD
jgi:small subunit ribosomal protein S6